jgi:hypothetical protein
MVFFNFINVKLHVIEKILQFEMKIKILKFNFLKNLGDDDKLSVLHPSATGSLSSITTTSLVSEQGASDGAGSDRGDDRSEKQLVGIKHEKWWQTTIQVAIPFFIAGIGTIGAGIILGRVEVS